MSLLESSNFYNFTVVLGPIISLPLYEEQIILFTKVFPFQYLLTFQLKSYHKALEVIVDKLKDYTRAEEYCTKFKDSADDLTLSLLKVYLSGPKQPVRNQYFVITIH